MDFTRYIDPVEFALELISRRSLSGEKDEGALDLLQETLTKLGFTCTRLPFASEGSYPVDNLFARIGVKKPHLAFAGHTDVVPPGDEKAWSVPPFKPAIKNGNLIGRGAVDMKGAIAAWVSAAAFFIGENNLFQGSLSLIITGDEEADAINGTTKMIDWMLKHKQTPEACIVGEPTNPERLGDMIKIGRRGSLSFDLTVHGTQGHVAYPDLADNPVTPLLKILYNLINERLDNGSEWFERSNLEVTSVDVGNPTANVIPAKAKAKFNVRFNDKWTREKVKEWVNKKCIAITDMYDLKVTPGSEAFVTEPGYLSNLLTKSVAEITGNRPELSTAGGTSDARFIRDVCPVVEFGLINKTAHKVDEQVPVKAIRDLTLVYKKVIEGYFS